MISFAFLFMQLINTHADLHVWQLLSVCRSLFTFVWGYVYIKEREDEKLLRIVENLLRFEAQQLPVVCFK